MCLCERTNIHKAVLLPGLDLKSLVPLAKPKTIYFFYPLRVTEQQTKSPIKMMCSHET